jgi:hypothetical protein
VSGVLKSPHGLSIWICGICDISRVEGQHGGSTRVRQHVSRFMHFVRLAWIHMGPMLTVAIFGSLSVTSLASIFN